MSEKSSQKSSDIIEKIVRTIEKDRTNAVTAFLMVTLFAFIRVFFEKSFLTPQEGVIFNVSIYNWAHDIAFFITAFLGGVVVISLISKLRVRKVANVVLFGFWVIILPPLIDYYIFGITDIMLYEYASITEIITNMTTLFLYASTTWGLRVQIVFILFLSSFYVYFRTKSISRGLLTPLCLYFVMATIGSVYVAPIEEAFSSNTIQVIYFEMFLFISIILAAITVDISNRKVLPSLLMNLRPYQMLHFVLIGLIGIIIAGDLMFVHDTGSIISSESFPYVVLCLLTLAFGWQFTGMINDVFDIEIDKLAHKKSGIGAGILTRSQHLHLAMLMAIISFALSILLGVIPMLLTISCIFLAWAYSFPPLRLKRNNVARSAIISLGSVLAFLIGYFTTNRIVRVIIIKPIVIGNYQLWSPASTTPLTLSATIIALIIFFATFLFYFYRVKERVKR